MDQATQILLIAQIALGIGYLLFLILLFSKKQNGALYILLSVLILSIVYFLLSQNLQTFFWGDKGDELFIGAFLTRVLDGQLFSDMYYANLPPFYPPLYFWVTGTISRLFTESSIVAGKIGVLGIFIVWFFGSYLMQYLYWIKEHATKIIHTQWFWVVLPFLYFVWLDFSEIITKPYETVSALLLVIWIGLFSISLNKDYSNTQLTGTKKRIWFFSIIGGFLFLTYHFWWFIIIPALFTIALLSKNKLMGIGMIFFIGIIMTLIASPYLAPLIYSFRNGVENWQAIHMVPSDFNVFMPWLSFSIKGLLAFIGLGGLIAFRKKPFVKASGIVLIFAYIWQIGNFIVLMTGGRPVHASKPFLFLGGATLMVGASYLLLWLYEMYLKNMNFKIKKSIIAILVLIAITRLFLFTNNPVVEAQITNDLQTPKGQYLAEIIKNTAPDYRNRIWLSSGLPELNLFIPISYYIAHNPHFSHQASKFSQRLNAIQSIVASQTSEQFNNATKVLGINALVLFKDNQKNSFVLFFDVDNFPNGSRSLQLSLDPTLIGNQWSQVFSDGEWFLYIRK